MIRAYLAALAALLAFMAWASWEAGAMSRKLEQAQLERAALECARTVDGGDMAIVDCYLDRGLPYPEGV